MAQPLDIFMRRTGSIMGNFFHIFKQSALGGREGGRVELTLENGIHTLISGSLNTQEVCVAVESIRAAIEVGNVAGNHLLVAAVEMAF